jgi:putative acetyltransferase
MWIRAATMDDRLELPDLWLRSVRATHVFLSEADIQGLLPLVREELIDDGLEIWLLCAESDLVIGFMGLLGSSVEALFLDPDHLRRGGGRLLLDHARQLKGKLTVDVNEQNPEAVRFYEACGFEVAGRSPDDGAGREFPLLHLRQP